MASQNSSNGSLATAGGLVLIGAGRMGSAMLHGWLDADLVTPDRVFVFDPAAGEELTALAGERGFALNPALDDVVGAEISRVILAVKPQVMAAIVPAYAGLWADHAALPLTVSIAAGVSLTSLSDLLPAGTPIVRTMPNTPAAIGMGITAMIGNDHVDDAGYALVDAMLGAVGKTVRLDAESQMDAVTAVSGSGPAYLFYLAECLTAAGTRSGLPEAMAGELARATIAGAAALMDGSDDMPSALRQAVTSPGGTTAAALDVLMADNGLADLMSRAVAAATARSRELDKK